MAPDMSNGWHGATASSHSTIYTAAAARCIVAVGQLVQVDWMGEPLQLKVHRLELECNGKTQEARIEPSTYFHVQEENNGKESVMLEDGEAPVGLVQAHTELRRFVRGILRLQAEGGTLHHCGLLVSGPHGSGKTNLVSQLLSALRPKEAAAVLDVSQLVSGDTSITASLAHRLVAKRLLVLEGLDVLAVQGSPSAEVVCGSIMQLLETLPPNLCIIGVTRDPGNLPTQLQSCHRLMGRLELRPPSRAARELIIRSLLTTTTYEATGSLADPEWTPCLRQVALKTPGWMPGDLCQLSRMAQLNALQDRGVKATVQPSDVQLALYQVTPEHVLSMPIQMPSATWDDFVGYQQEKEQAVQIVAGFFGGDVAVALRRLGACTAPAGLFLYGPSGCGKTMLANAIVDRFDANLVVLKVSDLLCQYLGETEAFIRRVFAHASLLAPCVLLFDEIDSLGVERGGNVDADGGVGKRALGQLLTELDGVSERKDIFVIAATSRPGNVDSALTRPGRFEHHVFLGLPSQSDIAAIIRAKQCTMPISHEVDIDTVAGYLVGATCATVDAVCREAAIHAFRRAASTIGVQEFTEAMKFGTQRPDTSQLQMFDQYRLNQGRANA